MWGELFKGPILHCFFINFTQLSEVQHCICLSSKLYWEQAVSLPAPLNANELRLLTPGLPATRPLREKMPLMLEVACANVYDGCIAMARWHEVVQPYQFDPDFGPEGVAPEEIQILWHFRMVSVSEYITKFVHMCCYIYYHAANG